MSQFINVKLHCIRYIIAGNSHLSFKIKYLKLIDSQCLIYYILQKYMYVQIWKCINNKSSMHYTELYCIYITLLIYILLPYLMLYRIVFI